jgi:hypothetical protein
MQGQIQNNLFFCLLLLQIERLSGLLCAGRSYLQGAGSHSVGHFLHREMEAAALLLPPAPDQQRLHRLEQFWRCPAKTLFLVHMDVGS